MKIVVFLKKFERRLLIILIIYILTLTGIVCADSENRLIDLQKHVTCLPDINDQKNELDYEAMISPYMATILIERASDESMSKNYRLEETECDFRIWDKRKKNEVLDIVISKIDQQIFDPTLPQIFCKSRSKYPKISGWLIEFKDKAEILLGDQ